MTKEELKKQLHSYRHLKAEQKQIDLEIQRIEALMTSPRGAGLNGMPRGAGSGDPVHDSVSKKQSLKDRYNVLSEELAAAQSSIEDMIECLESEERKLMRHRYIEGLEWEEVCAAIGYSWSQTHRLHRKALNNLLRQLNGK